jgi:hypothetical protein
MRHPHLADACLAEPVSRASSSSRVMGLIAAEARRRESRAGYGISSNARPFGHMEDPSRCGPSVGTV